MMQVQTQETNKYVIPREEILKKFEIDTVDAKMIDMVAVDHGTNLVITVPRKVRVAAV